MESVAYIALGANIPSPAGPPVLTLVAAVQQLARLGKVICRSSLYSTQPVGLAEQPRFINAVVALNTLLDARQLLQALLEIERAFGRDRSHGVPNGPRTLDLDLLLFGNIQIHEPALQLPHPRMHQRLFVLVPLHEIAPDLLIAPLQRTVKELLQDLRAGSAAENDAILPLQSDLWHPHPCGHSSLRANARERQD